MTIRQIHYTSCDDGVEGIQGFQVRAITPDVPAGLRDTALRDSVYEPGPGQPSLPSPEQLARFPVALGYSPHGSALVLYQSRYVGRDHTGRWGNYFAQALTVDDPAELAGVLPIELWRSPMWQPSSGAVGELPALVGLATLPDGADGGTGAGATRRFLAGPGRLEALAGALEAVRAVLGGGAGRVVVVADDSAAAALWISAITRSLPRRLALQLSFVTYTARPESHRALLTCTTPDVTVPTYGDYRVLDLSAHSGAGAADPPAWPPADYERVLSQLWARETPERLVAAAGEVSPPVQAGELDRFARMATLVEAYPVRLDWDDDAVLDALDFAAARAPAVLFTAWDRVAEIVREAGGPQDVARWSQLLRMATGRGAPVPGPLLRGYLRAAVEAAASDSVPGSMWLPELDPHAARELSEQLLAPALLDRPGPSLLSWLAEPAHGTVRDAVLRSLHERLTPPVLLEDAVQALPAAVAGLIAEQSSGLVGQGMPGLELVADVVLARQGHSDPVELVVGLDPAVVASYRDGWRRLAVLLWPEPPTPAEATRLLRTAPTPVLAAAGLPDQFVERLMDDARQEGLNAEHVRLAAALAASPSFADLGANGPATVQAVELFGYFSTGPAAGRAAADRARTAIELAGALDGAVAGRLHAALASWLLAVQGWEPHRLLLQEFSQQDPRFLDVYCQSAQRELAEAGPDVTARLVVAWVALSSMRATDRLLEQVLPAAVGRRGRRHLDRVGAALQAQAERVPPGVSVFVPQGGWPDWWRRWRGRHEREGLVSGLVSRLLPARSGPPRSGGRRPRR